ncbi:dynein regulatory complex protein 10 isoform X2 [Brienomyrus brachyistius]|uniref:dynein regulatory complex protein 10 isoform X2 n=1 Tax=Brienomyrus brachyistius TaxID=42636 RepID=UPI0020B245C4|nr:dynein regulatory complex protein 10 isoform X2 [Brienomyrus brachyistius]
MLTSERSYSMLHMEMAQTLSSAPQSKAAKEDLVKVVVSSPKKLASLEVQCIARVLDECIQKVYIVLQLPSLLVSLEGVFIDLGEELVEALKEHQQIEDTLDAQHLKYLEMETEERQAEMDRLEQGVRSSLKNILQLLFANPAAMQMLQNRTVSMASHQLVQGLKKLHDLLLEKLLIGPGEEWERNQNFKEVAQQHRSSMELVSLLEAEVTTAVQDRDAEISNKNEIIYNLKTSLYHMKKSMLDFVTHTQNDAEKQSQSDRKISEGRCVQLQQEVNQLHIQLSNLIAENRGYETVLRKRVYKIESETENWIQKYDKDIGEKQEKEELQELEEHYALLEVEFLQIMDEKRLAKQQAEKEQQDLAVRSRAALTIQAYWRGHRVRKMMRVKSKHKKGKKGK